MRPCDSAQGGQLSKVDVWVVAVKQVSELVPFWRDSASVRLFFQTENRLREPAIPLQRGVGVIRLDPLVNPSQIPLGAGGDFNAICHVRLRIPRRTRSLAEIFPVSHLPVPDGCPPPRLH